MQNNRRIHLSAPDLTTIEARMIHEAVLSNWIAPIGPDLDAFEQEVAEFVCVPYTLALNSGTAGISLALRLLGVGSGDEVFCSSLTFVASASPIVQLGAIPVFIDSEPLAWNIDPDLLESELERASLSSRLPKAIIVVDLYGQTANYSRIVPLAKRYGVPILCDAAEALGASHSGCQAGSFGTLGVFSFNGNKILTTSGGGMLVSGDHDLIAKGRFLATHAKDPAPHYQHTELGYSYRLSNVLAALGRGQLRTLADRMARKRRINLAYREAFANHPGIEFQSVLPGNVPNHWLTCITIDPKKAGFDREDLRIAFEAVNIESRPVWKPLHLQPVFQSAKAVGGAVSEQIFVRGLCLPSGSSMSDQDLERVHDVVAKVSGNAGRRNSRRRTIEREKASASTSLQ